MRATRTGRPEARLAGAVCLLALGALLAGCTGGGAAQPETAATAPATTPTPAPTRDPFPSEPLTATTRYIAIGDSYAAGMGGGEEQGACRLSANGYPAQFARRSGVDLVVNAACAGATTTDLLAHQLLALDDRTDLVTLSVGGNDLGVAAIATDCAARRAEACRNEVTGALSLLNVLPDRLDDVYAAVAKAAPNARIVVTGYALMWDAADPSAPDFQTSAAMNAATIGLNEVIRQAVDKQRAAGVAMTYVEPDFAGHAINDPVPWLHHSGPYAFHPTARGYAEYTKRLLKLLGTAS
ncbi:SGNH/GDSL hydrolase family protein [Leifsonia sp. AG29]|uniref:SGNH/GDSL hydrolase family protein n=1 Tax=Leifsonia sp. AG29 TaxID=2598860 RepID=UPI001E2F17AA|nr:SGNH/GDSL hydrolase family protein [Leifsonia sp. AG29]